MDKISNENFIAAKSDLNNVGIIHCASKGFRRFINESELNQLCDIALWKSLLKYKNDKNTKFTSFLYSMVRWEIMDYLSQINKIKTVNIDNVPDIEYSSIDIYGLLDCLTDTERDILIRKEIGGQTLVEIGNHYSECKETIRKKILKIKQKLQNDHV